MSQRITTRVATSQPQFVGYPVPPDGAPNVLVVVLDDVGFAQLGCFGGVRTPNIDRLAGAGLRFNRFHVTSVCSSTRACVLTGRNHHAVGMGFLTDIPIGFPGYNGRIPRSAATMPRLLRDAGYSTFAVGKWHLIPRWEQSASGPFDRWPLGLGFERYYGFLAGDTNQFSPELVSDMAPCVRPWKPPRKAMIPGRRVAYLASFTAASIASAPELDRKRPASSPGSRPGNVRGSRSCSSRPGWWYRMFCWAWMIFPACSAIAAATRGWACPVFVTAIPQV